MHLYRQVDPLGLASISRSVTISAQEGRPLVGCYSLGFFVHLAAEMCFSAFAGSTFEYRCSVMLSPTVSTDPS